MENNNFRKDEKYDNRDITRYRALHKLYEISDGESKVPKQIEDLQKGLGLNEVELDRTLNYLHNEGLVEKRNLSVRITHDGIKEIEQSETLPQEGTEHFNPTIIQNFNAPVGAVQNASHSVANVNQNIDGRSVDFKVVVARLNEEISHLPENEKDEAAELVESLVEQVELPQPRWKTIKVIAKGLGQFLSSTASSVLADFITKSSGG